MLMPKRVKRRKQFRGSMAGKALRGNKITMGEFGIVATEDVYKRQIYYSLKAFRIDHLYRMRISKRQSQLIAGLLCLSLIHISISRSISRLNIWK